MSENLLDTAVKVKALQDLIINQAQAVYGPQHPQGHTFSVLLSRRGTVYIAQIIVYTVPDSFSTFKVVSEAREQPNALRGSPSSYTALCALGRKVQREVNARIPDLGIGKTWDGSVVGDE